MSLSTPVALFIFKRSELAEKVLEAIRQAKPQKLLVVADGSRYPEEAEQCQKTRAILQKIDWNCEVLTNFSATNLGCKKRVSSGLDWVFSQVDKAIILEDDTLPSPSFFSFCSELLDVYRLDDRVMAIGGTNPLITWKHDRQDYHFSYQGSIWGWASWRRAWSLYDRTMENWGNQDIQKKIRELSFRGKYFRIRQEMFDKVKSNQIDTWDYQWLYTRLIHQGLTIIPSQNLISNIGFGAGATHTINVDSKLAALPTFSIDAPLRHPSSVEIDKEYDLQALDFILNNQGSNSKSRKERLIHSLRKVFKN